MRVRTLRSTDRLPYIPAATLLFELRDAADGRRRRYRLQPSINVRDFLIRQHLCGIRDHLVGGPANIRGEPRPGGDAAGQSRAGIEATMSGQTVALPACTVHP